MNVAEIEIKKKSNGKIQYLTEVLKEIPTNTILCKTLTGLGATYGEIKAKRHSIIIEPNKPVIVGKYNDSKHKDDNLFPVHEGIYSDDIVNYIENTFENNSKQERIAINILRYSRLQKVFQRSNLHLRKLITILGLIASYYMTNVTS